jgi:prepilin-type N-terminal cleavage/methylation domain-containing protein
MKRFIQSKRFIPNSSKGLTLIELIVTLVIGGILLSLTLSLLVSNRKLYVEDLARTEVNQNLRAAMDIIGTDLKQAGERITEENFPVIEVKNSSELIIRLNLGLPILRTCQNISAGSNTTNISATCEANTKEDLEEWQTHRCSLDKEAGCQNNSQERVKAFIHDGNGEGEYFTYISEDTTNSSINKLNDGKSWKNSYSEGSTIYILEERRYQLIDKKIQVIVDGNSDRPLKIINGVEDFVIKVSMQNPTIETGVFPFKDNDGNTYRWWRLQSIKVNIKSFDPSPGATNLDPDKLKVSGQFFPRNSLSR